MDARERRDAEELSAWCETLSFAAAMSGVLVLGLAPGLLPLGLVALAIAALLLTVADAVSPEGAEGLAYWARGIR